MKKKILISIPLFIILLVIVRLIIVSYQQEAEFEFHSSIPRTIKLSSKDFVNNGTIPIEFTGNGKGISPSLKWSNLPEGTKSVVIFVVDYDVPAPYLKLLTVDHWVVYNINPTISSFEKDLNESNLPDKNIRFGKGLRGILAYKGPKPPLGKHSYYFRIYALSVPSLTLSKPSKEDVMAAIQNNVLAYGELVGKY